MTHPVFTSKRINTPIAHPVANTNIHPRYEIEKAAWLWHPDYRCDDVAALRFINQFTLDQPITTKLHVSADQRYELYLDGELVSQGPDRSSSLRWSFATYEIALDYGKHELVAVVYWLDKHAPAAQVSLRGGFILAAEGLEHILNTGTGDWQVEPIQGWSFTHHQLTHVYHVTGDCQQIDGHLYYNATDQLVPAVVIKKPIPEVQTHDGYHNGVAQAPWQLYPSDLPDQMRQRVTPGTIRAVTSSATDQPITKTDTQSSDIPTWQALIDKSTAVTVSPNQTVRVLWDLDNYYCAYAFAKLTGGEDSSLHFEWAESLHENHPDAIPTHNKGNRSEVEGKIFIGNGDSFLNDGRDNREYRTYWWRSGRYVQITVKTGSKPLTIEQLAIDETRYPLENESSFSTNDASIDALIPFMVRGLQMCSHETYMDCPYYEQIMYVGDTRLEMLVNYVITQDDRLPKRGIQLFDWSRWRTGFVAERYPSEPYQLSLTFSMIWIYMLRDFAYWRNDAEQVKQHLIGMRSQLEYFRPLLNSDNMLEKIPGWSFVDWVWGNGWANGCPEGAKYGVSSIINLQFVKALLDAADLEEHYGEQVMADRNRDLAAKVAQATIDKFWVEDKGMIADDVDHQYFSQHAQLMALLTDVLPEDKQQPCLDNTLNNQTIAQATVYFSYYLLETMYKFGRGDAILKKLDMWKDMVAKGFKTTPEREAGTRSDCHAWGAHPLHHFHASLAGVRPAAPGFQKVNIAPQPGSLKNINATLPHPNGEITTNLTFENNTATGTITLPNGIDGKFEYNGKICELKAGENTITG